jgi:6-phosphofructokinase 1
VELAIAGHNSIMPTVVRKSSDPYVWEIGHAPLSEVANVEKFMPKDFISEDGYGITDKCREYLYPLIEGEDYPPFDKGMPKYVTLVNAPVEKKLGAFEL